MAVIEFLVRLGGILVGLGMLGAGVSVMMTSRPLIYTCGRNCAIAGVLSLLGEPIDRILYGSLFMGLGIYVTFIMVRPRRKHHNSSKSESSD